MLPLRVRNQISPISQRSIFNLNYLNYECQYAFINHVCEGDQSIGPYGSDFDAVSTPWNQLIDTTTGYPNSATASGHKWGGQFKMPKSSDFSGPYVITWDGDGTLEIQGDIQFGATLTWTETNNTGTTYTKISNGKWSNISGQTAKIILNVTGITNPTLIGWAFTATGGSGGFARNLRVYRQADETDLLAGKIYRSQFKQNIIDHDPSAIRFLNWGMAFSYQVRFEHRMLPTMGAYSLLSNYALGPLYSDATGTNQYAIDAVTTGAKQTPASHQHGEMVCARFTNAAVRVGSGALSISGISIVDSTHINVNVASHPYSVGDKVIHICESGMTQIDRYPTTITSVPDANHYICTVPNTAILSAFTSGSACAYLSLNVGIRGDTMMVRGDGKLPAAWYGDAIGAGGNFIASNKWACFYYDKNCIGVSDGQGNYSKGVWIWAGTGPGWGDTPLEIMTALILELNAMSPSKPIHMYVSVPFRGLTSIDPDYDATQNYPVKMVDVIWNGANGYQGIGSNFKINLFLEYADELWNPGQNECQHMTWGAFSRWGSVVGRQNFCDYHTLRAVAVASDVKAAGFTSPRIKHVFGVMFWTGFSPGQPYSNYEKLIPSSNAGNSGQAGYSYYHDATVIANGWQDPMPFFDCWAGAPYLNIGNTYEGGTGAGSFSDDSAMYNGTGPYAGAANPSQAITNFCNQINSSADGTGLPCNQALTKLDEFLAHLPSYTYMINYEGALDSGIATGDLLHNSHTLTSADSAFMQGVVASSAWATVQKNFFDNWCARGARCAMPALYYRLGGVNGSKRWALAFPDTYSGGTEGAALTGNPTWSALSTRNAGIV